MKKTAAYGLALLNVMLFATYYSVEKEALSRFEPVVFVCGVMLLLLPAGLGLLISARNTVNQDVLMRGSLLGAGLFGVNILLAGALQHTSATATAFFPCLNGIIAALFCWLVLRRSLHKLTWLAAMLAVIGMGLMMADHPLFSQQGEWRGDLLALFGGVLYTGYIFLVGSLLIAYTATRPSAWRSILGAQFLSMAALAVLTALLFGDWHALHPLPVDLWALLYVAGAIILLPTLIGAFMQKYVEPVTVSFIYILEPILSAVVAFFYLHEFFSPTMYAGEVLVLFGVMLQTIVGFFSDHLLSFSLRRRQKRLGRQSST